MAPPTRRRLVIDASVAAACGGAASCHATAQECRGFLITVLEICHRLVLTPEIRDEWKMHRSRFASTWLTSMFARKKVVALPSRQDGLLRSSLAGLGTSKKAHRTMLKDVHLVEAAFQGDRIVVSLDEEARQLYADASQSVGSLRNVVWVNAALHDDRPLCWLRRGAQPDKARLLGHRKEVEGT